MPETPDFDQLARRLSVPGIISGDPEVWIQLIAEQLRLVWNARGAADIAQLRVGYFSSDAEQTIERAVRGLDR